MTGVTIVGVRGHLVAAEAHVGRELSSLTGTGCRGPVGDRYLRTTAPWFDLMSEIEPRRRGQTAGSASGAGLLWRGGGMDCSGSRPGPLTLRPPSRALNVPETFRPLAERSRSSDRAMTGRRVGPTRIPA
jgi:hypothetical protein